MIVSCHIPKTAGTSFGRALKREFGDAAVFDYGDRVGWEGADAEKWRSVRSASGPSTSASTRVVHGHFYLAKYSHLPESSMVAFLRDPAERVVSNYQFLLANKQIDHPLVRQFHRSSPKLTDWIRWAWARDLQTKVLRGFTARDLEFIGITERYVDSLHLFDQQFGTSLASHSSEERLNESSQRLQIGVRIRNEIRALNEQDCALYEQALSLFESGVRRCDR